MKVINRLTIQVESTYHKEGVIRRFCVMPEVSEPHTTLEEQKLFFHLGNTTKALIAVFNAVVATRGEETPEAFVGVELPVLDTTKFVDTEITVDRESQQGRDLCIKLEDPTLRGEES